MRRTSAIGWMWAVCASLMAQREIGGTVKDEGGVPLEDVKMRCADEVKATDVHGEFTLNMAADSRWVDVTFSKVGYKIRRMRLYAGEHDVEVFLQDSVEVIDDVEVRGAYFGKMSNYYAQINPLGKLDALVNPSAKGDMMQGLTVLPGVQTNSNDGRLIINGGDTDETQVYVDGLLYHSPYKTSPSNTSTRAKFSPDLFTSGYSLYTSGYGAQYGQALSGVLNLDTRQHIDPKVHINLVSAYAETAAMGSVGRLQYCASVQYMNLAPYTHLFPDHNHWSRYYNCTSPNLYLQYKTAGGGMLKTYLAYDYASLAYQDNQTSGDVLHSDIRSHTLYGSVVWQQPLAAGWRLYAGVNYGYNRFNGAEVSVPCDAVRESTHDVHAKLSLTYSSGPFTNVWGVEDLYNGLEERYVAEDVYGGQSHNHNLAVFDDFSWFATQRFNLGVGLRAEHSTRLKQTAVAPRLYAIYKFSKESGLSFSAGRYLQLPKDAYLLYSRHLRMREDYSSTVSYSYDCEAMKWQVDLFAKRYRYLTTITSAAYQAYPETIRSSGDGKAAGVNVFCSTHIGRCELYSSYSHIYSRVQKDLYSTSLMPSYLSPNRFDVTAKYWISRWHSMVGFSFYLDDGLSVYNPYTSSSLHTPNRSATGLSWSYLPVKNLIINIGCDNVFARKNVCGYSFASDGENYTARPVTPSYDRFFVLGVFWTLSRSGQKNQLNKL